jgi:hypothetical protein
MSAAASRVRCAPALSDLPPAPKASAVPSSIDSTKPRLRPFTAVTAQTRMLWISSVAVFLLSASLTFTVCCARSPHSLIRGILRRRAISARTSLGMHVERLDRSLIVKWNPQSRAVHFGINGILQIDDGTQHSKLQLDSDQLTSGSVMYAARRNSVTFRLKVFDGNGSTVSESLLVIGASRD